MYRILAAVSVFTIIDVFGKPITIGTAAETEIIDYPRYAFNYAVNDPYTKDNKAQWEERDGDVVKGGYSVREPDGNLRIVEYTASNAQGFNAVVKKVGANVHPITVTQKNINQIPLPVLPIVPVVKPIVKLPELTAQPLVTPLTYGLGPAPLAINVPKATLFGQTSLPWDPLTSSYGGWVPLPTGPHAYIISKKYIDGDLHKRIIGPISLVGQKLIIRTSKNEKLL